MDNRQKEIDNLKDYKYGFTTDIESTKAPKGLNEEVIKFISNIKKKDIFFKRKKNNVKLISLNNKLLSKFKGRFSTSLNSIIQLSILLNKNNNKDSIVFSFQSHIFPILICRLFSKKIIIRNFFIYYILLS